MARQRSNLETVWRAVERAGSIERYVDEQLVELGYLIERRPTDSMSKRERDAYKKQLKEEAAERRRLRSEAWAAYKANHVVHLGEGVFWNDGLDWDKWDLEHAEERAAENELPPLDNPRQLAEALEITVAELRWFAYHRDLATMVHYRRFTIPKRRGGERPIWAPRPRLKAIQRWILRNVAERLPVHGAAHGFLPGRSIVTNAAAHTGSRIVLNMDLEGFFPTVTLPRVKGLFRKAGYREQIALLLALLCTEAPREVVDHAGKTYFVALGPRCLPQGAPTSPAITNAICLRLDRRLTGLARKFGWRYTRYADDMTFSLPTDAKDEGSIGKLMGLVKRTVADEGFRVHPEKTRVARTGSSQRVTGMVVNGDGPPRVPREMKRRLRAAIHNHHGGKPLQAGETLATLHGYVAHIQSAEPEVGRRLLAELLGEVE